MTNISPGSVASGMLITVSVYWVAVEEGRDEEILVGSGEWLCLGKGVKRTWKDMAFWLFDAMRCDAGRSSCSFTNWYVPPTYDVPTTVTCGLIRSGTSWIMLASAIPMALDFRRGFKVKIAMRKSRMADLIVE